MTVQIATAAILVVAALLAVARLLAGWRRQRGRVRAWRPVLLLALQPPLAVLLYCTLFPPPRQAVAPATLTVLTEGASADEVAQAHARGTVLALPEAATSAGVPRIPDLATALRRHPDVSRVHVAGHGLVPRDRDAVGSIVIEPSSTPLPDGLQRLDVPARIVAGATLAVSGQVGGIADARVELLDPAKRRVDATRVDDDGRFTVSTPMLAAGLVDLELRVLDAAGHVRESARVPVAVEASSTPRVLLLAGAPHPETRALRRWMQDAGFEVQTRISLGAGMQLGEAATLTADGLRELDLVVVDARAWTALGAQGQATLLRGVEAGLGMLLRVDTPVASAAWAPLRAAGFAIDGGAAVEAFAPGMPRVAAGNPAVPGADTDASTPSAPAQVPGLSRRNVRVPGNSAIPLVPARDGTPLGWWRAHGQGRIAVWTALDTWRLPLLGHRDVHVSVWNEAVAPLVRASEAPSVAFVARNRVGERTVICGAGEGAFVSDPEDTRVDLLNDPAADDCAAFWPRAEGWHRLHDGERVRPFHVRDVDALPALRATTLRAATWQLAARPLEPETAPTDAAMVPTGRPPGSPWPWFLAWLSLATIAWIVERSRWGRVPDRA